MKEKFHEIMWFWKKYVFTYRFLWNISFALQLAFFFISAVLPFFFKKVIDSLTTGNVELFVKFIALFLVIEITQVLLLYTKGYAIRFNDFQMH
ncbi:hypothetical protein JYK00_02025 [Thermosipho ferrireducens]|uniref:ABC transporter ATP-binding protein n=1 Tax=Thermosipho ferrireducens TaxID=2571116 RepID=A0ABX7S6X2_9BACT|nr:hypothetical protein [Thermosipho ferrireducens]QTA38338.1 hypothetical protein JYK00_02025 [Thermosipho ferrireducens]